MQRADSIRHSLPVPSDPRYPDQTRETSPCLARASNPSPRRSGGHRAWPRFGSFDVAHNNNKSVPKCCRLRFACRHEQRLGRATAPRNVELCQFHRGGSTHAGELRHWRPPLRLEHRPAISNTSRSRDSDKCTAHTVMPQATIATGQHNRLFALSAIGRHEARDFDSCVSIHIAHICICANFRGGGRGRQIHHLRQSRFRFMGRLRWRR